MGTRIYLLCASIAVTLVWLRRDDEVSQDPPRDLAVDAAQVPRDPPTETALAAAKPNRPTAEKSRFEPPDSAVDAVQVPRDPPAETALAAAKPQRPTAEKSRFEPPEEPANARLVSVADAPEWRTFEPKHRHTIGEFVAQNGFGYARVVDLPALDSWRVGDKAYTLRHHLLIGTWRYESPRAYRPLYGRHDGKKESRKLTSLEADAVAMFGRGDQIVVDAVHGIVFGAIRAQKNCLECHDAKIGDLLGAFRYAVAPYEDSLVNLVPSKYAPPTR